LEAEEQRGAGDGDGAGANRSADENIAVKLNAEGGREPTVTRIYICEEREGERGREKETYR